MPQQQRDLLFATGNVVGVEECSVSSLQPQHFADVTRRPLTLVLWGMTDRFGVAPKQRVDVLKAKNWNEARSYCEDLRPTIHVYDNLDVVTRWEKPEGAEP